MLRCIHLAFDKPITAENRISHFPAGSEALLLLINKFANNTITTPTYVDFVLHCHFISFYNFKYDYYEYLQCLNRSVIRKALRRYLNSHHRRPNTTVNFFRGCS